MLYVAGIGVPPDRVGASRATNILSFRFQSPARADTLHSNFSPAIEAWTYAVAGAYAAGAAGQSFSRAHGIREVRAPGAGGQLQDSRRRASLESAEPRGEGAAADSAVDGEYGPRSGRWGQSVWVPHGRRRAANHHAGQRRKASSVGRGAGEGGRRRHRYPPPSHGDRGGARRLLRSSPSRRQLDRRLPTDHRRSLARTAPM